MTRCGIDTTSYIEDEDFQPIFDFNSPTSVYALGKAVSTVTEEVFREIEVTIKQYERNHTAERGNDYGTHIYTERGLSDTRHSGARNGAITGQIRHDAEELPTRPPRNTVHDIHNAGQVISPLLGTATNNLNQIAKRSNETRSIFESDIKDLQVGYEKLWQSAESIMKKLAKI